MSVSPKARRITLILGLLGLALALLIAYPVDIERPEYLTFEGTAPDAFDEVVVTVGARSDSRLWLCRNYAPGFEGAGGKARGIERTTRIRPDGSFRITVDPREVGLGGPCRYTLTGAALSARKRNTASVDRTIVNIARDLRLVDAALTSSDAPELKIEAGGASELLDVCCQLDDFLSCRAADRTLKRWANGRTVRVNIHGQAESCYPELKQVEAYR